mmetsp:Transcript_21578/g.60066  ORF Transcript_21578/g.60066 Transcript_21578/m.60066 type:complete len:94 (-) Transcript_21578:621-902(-)
MQAWAKDQKTGLSMVQLMGDPAGDLTKALDMEMTHPGPMEKGLYGRCKRSAVYAVNGTIKAVHISEGPDDPAGDGDPSHTLAEAMLKAIEESK